MQIHKVYVRTYRRSFAFSVTWINSAGTLRPESSQCEVIYPPGTEDKPAEELWDVFVAGIKAELERSGPLRAESLNVSLSDYCAAVDKWGGDIFVM